MTADKYAYALSHPIRVAVIRYMKSQRGAKLSPTQIAAETGHPLTHVSYHVKILHEAGALRTAGTRQGKGILQHFYTLDQAALRQGLKALTDLV